MKYIDSEKLIAEIDRKMKCWEGEGLPKGIDSPYCTLKGIRKYVETLRQEQPEIQNGKFVFPKYLYARTKDNKTIDMSYAPQDMTAIEYVRNDFVQQEQPDKYETALEKAREWMPNVNQGGHAILIDIFPELGEGLDPRYGGRKQKQPIKVYRVENEKEQKGLWRKFDGTWEPLFDMLTDGQCKDIPMEDSPIYREGGKQWFASAPSRETLQKWFSKKDLEELTAKGFTISEFEVIGYKKVSDFEYIFTRDNIISRTYLKVSDIYPQEQAEVDLFEHPETPIKDAIEVTSRMKYIDEELKPIAEFIMSYASWNLHKNEWNQPTIEVPLFRVLDALAQRGKPYCGCVNARKEE